ncbi:tRNA glutamyl-Q(34) synthetase GluQRS [Rhodoferax antarcticus]|uniref:Glutamyl-Q tRNA(Asp) synthetase n=1 Tax=Rhodoferax antarcticus ANT.BR TaxID=1111071 RepID=A0A1Q8YA34_9BURK|nr:tRNA glutamyl-Q(34) synthetase GluQRS [Rhodoferax antarcticus]APW46961.1 tRNA glutamyl-Q(34) synthetase GluQRS [Rhodoferax antarcticus]OLP04807.1 glutamyl-Q tRNA(Asp) synthetase [Rhodoferax antarcticus ANT.BR]
MTHYTGRFAPSPTGPLHAGSLVAALASWLDARAHQGTWLVRIEDVDTPRCLAGMDQTILQQLALCGLHPDQPVLYQSRRADAYQQALDALVQRGLAYACGCSRRKIEATLAQHGAGKPRHGELIYPGTCRAGRHGTQAPAWRLRTDVYIRNMPLALINKALVAPDSIVFSTLPAATAEPIVGPITWSDRRLGTQQQDVAATVGDFVVKRSDACFAYQLAVVVDDAAQGTTNVVRGEDLTDNTARQILLQRALGLPTPRYLHTPLVLGANGEKLSKQNGAVALDLQQPLTALNAAAQVLGLAACTSTVPQALLAWTRQWKTLW